MKITGRQLRQIISEEILRSHKGKRINEVRGDSLPDDVLRALDTAGDDLEDAPMGAVKMPAQNQAAAGIDYNPNQTARARFEALKQIRQQIPDMSQEIMKLIADRKINADLNSVVKGEKVLQMGSTGPAVKVYQAAVLANLMAWIKAHRGATSATGISGEEVADKAINSNGNVTDEDLRAGVYDIVTMGGFVPDGNYGPITRAAVALLQVIMDRKQILSTFGGAPVDWDAAIDGKIGRQTATFLSGLTILAPVSGITAADAGKKSMTGSIVKENSSINRWSQLAGIMKD